MKKFILIIALGALNAFAIDCLRSTLDIFIKDYPTSTEPTILNYKNFLVDSIYSQQGYSSQPQKYENYKYYYTGSYVDSARVYTKKKGSDDWEIKVQDHESLNYGALDVKITITQEGDSCSEAGMTKEPNDAETCLHVSISEANKSGHEVEWQYYKKAASVALFYFDR